MLSADTVIDRHLDPLQVTLFSEPRQPSLGRRMWLQTSPEFGMKRLLAAGAEKIYQVTRAFRGGERGTWHNPEFTIAEWYRVGDGLMEGMQLLSELSDDLLGRGPAELLSYRDAFHRWLDVDPHTAGRDRLADAARRLDVDVPPNTLEEDRDAWLDLLLVERIQPRLGQKRPTILFDYPASQASLARVRDEQTPVAERFELFVSGVELANGYHELLDPQVLSSRNETANHQRRQDGKAPLPADSRLLAAMNAGLPPCSGTALGFDRLVMLATGSQDISEVLTFPIELA